MKLLAIFIILLDGAFCQDDCITNVGAGLHEFTCQDFPTVTLFTNVPPRCLVANCGVIFDVHGGLMNAALENNNTNMWALGEANGFVVVTPSKSTLSWSGTGGDDLAVRTFIDRVVSISQWNIDPARIHFTGFSQGGSMSWRFICEHSDILASAAPANAGSGGSNDCFTSGTAVNIPQIPIFSQAGLFDVGYDSQRARNERIVELWNMTFVEIVSRDPNHSHTRYINSRGTILEYVEHSYRARVPVFPDGHCFPGGDDVDGSCAGCPFLSVGLSCPFPNTSLAAYHWGEEAVRFFLANPKKGARKL